MKYLASIILLLSLVAVPAGAQGVFGHVGHYVRTHKELLASDAITLLALSADAASSVHCQSLNPPCIDTSPALGKHPTAGKTWGLLLGLGAFEVAGDHMVVYLANDDPVNYGYMRHFIWIPTVFIAGIEGPTVWNNVCVAEHDQAAARQAVARARLAQ